MLLDVFDSRWPLLLFRSKVKSISCWTREQKYFPYLQSLQKFIYLTGQSVWWVNILSERIRVYQTALFWCDLNNHFSQSFHQTTGLVSWLTLSDWLFILPEMSVGLRLVTFGISVLKLFIEWSCILLSLELLSEIAVWTLLKLNFTTRYSFVWYEWDEDCIKWGDTNWNACAGCNHCWFHLHV